MEDAMLVGEMVIYFCPESVPPMTARQGLVAAALLWERECFQHLVPLLTIPAKLHTALTPAKSKNVRENYWNTSLSKYDCDESFCSSSRQNRGNIKKKKSNLKTKILIEAKYYILKSYFYIHFLVVTN
jgi:hypothetical protein